MVPLYEQDFSTLSDADILPGGDETSLLMAKTWYARNVAKMDSLMSVLVMEDQDRH